MMFGGSFGSKINTNNNNNTSEYFIASSPKSSSRITPFPSNNNNGERQKRKLLENTRRLPTNISVRMNEIELIPKQGNSDLFKEFLYSDSSELNRRFVEQSPTSKQSSDQHSYFTKGFLNNNVKTSPSNRIKTTTITIPADEDARTTDVEDLEILGKLESTMTRTTNQKIKKENNTLQIKSKITNENNENRNENFELRNKLLKITSLNGRLEDRIKTLEQDNDDYKRMAQSKDIVIKELHCKLDEVQFHLGQEIFTIREKSREYENKIEELNNLILEKEKSIVDSDRIHLKPIIDEYNSTINNLQEQIELERKEFNENILQLKNIINIKEKEILDLKENLKLIDEKQQIIEKKEQEIRTLKLFNENNMTEIDRLKKQTQQLLEDRKEFSEQVKEELKTQLQEGKSKDERISYLETLVSKLKSKMIESIDEYQNKLKENENKLNEEKDLNQVLKDELTRIKLNERSLQKIDMIRDSIKTGIKEINHLMSLMETDGIQMSSNHLQEALQNDGDVIILTNILLQRIEFLKSQLTEKYAEQLNECLHQ
ncbi:hypothetical protein ABK040_007880 [Willaertia magna]